MDTQVRLEYEGKWWELWKYLSESVYELSAGLAVFEFCGCLGY
ncbi:hypothetical protein HMPREF9370_1368 [Neisseria wadsworthii 9715]|uniref:Uncharacterized protein n=1 Tax=Neisseria wadsworthii 9715 TaxID=1030841 RepID=G4CQK8_9NEIS|nr:hypothetical protein HMPREF9370_1368 [Neisseria wadsworthii 9715]